MFDYCEISEADGITIIHFTRSPSYDECTRVIDHLVEKEAYQLRLWDFSAVYFNFSMQEIQAIAAYGKSVYPEPNRMATVAPQDAAYGTLRALDVYRDQRSFSSARAFRTTEEAMSWLEGERESLAAILDEFTDS